MEIAFVAIVCAAVAGPLMAAAWTLKRRDCPHCGASVDADPMLVKMFTGE
jgi:hypothetical protein